MKNETRYIVSDAVSIPVIRIASKGEAYRMVTKPGWGLVEWYSAEDGYKNPVNRDRSDKTQVMYCDDDCDGTIYGKDGSAFYILPCEEINMKDAPTQAETETIIYGDSDGFSFWTKGKIKIFVTYTEDGVIDTYRIENENGTHEAWETEISFEDLQSEADFWATDRADIPGTFEYMRKQEQQIA